jgi:hypothetical protein
VHVLAHAARLLACARELLAARASGGEAERSAAMDWFERALAIARSQPASSQLLAQPHVLILRKAVQMALGALGAQAQPSTANGNGRAAWTRLNRLPPAPPAWSWAAWRLDYVEMPAPKAREPAAAGKAPSPPTQQTHASTDPSHGVAPAGAPPVRGDTVLVSSSATNAALAERQRQSSLFVPAVRRDVYKVLLCPRSPGTPPPPTAAGGGTVFGVGLALRGGESGGPADAFCLYELSCGCPLGMRQAEPSALSDAISAIGGTSPASHALTLAFESFLARLAACAWTSAHVQPLSVEFLVAFSCELTPRLDVHDRIRSSELSAPQVRVLSSPPFCAYANQETSACSSRSQPTACSDSERCGRLHA